MGSRHRVHRRARSSSRFRWTGRMTVCNMSIEGGARAGMVAPDDTDLRVHARPAPRAPGRRLRRSRRWNALAHAATRTTAPVFDKRGGSSTAADSGAPRHLGDQPGPWWRPMDGPRARPDAYDDAGSRAGGRRAGTGVHGASSLVRPSRRSPWIDRVFIGSCTNSRIEDLRSVRRDGGQAGKKVSGGRVRDPGGTRLCMQVKKQAEDEGLARRFQGRRLRLASRRAARCASA